MGVIGFLIVMCINSAIFLFVIGVVLGARGANLRRTAAALFLAAFLPGVLISLAREASGAVFTTVGANPIAIVVVAILVSVGAYCVLHLRGDAKRGSGANRIQMKRPFTHRGDADLIAMLRDRMGRDE